MTRAQQPSILSYFQKQQSPRYAAPPPTTATTSTSTSPPPVSEATSTPPPPQAPPLPVPRQQIPTSNSLNRAVPPVNAAPTTILAPHPSATIVPIVEAHIPALRRINTLLLPVNYQESFYNGILDPAVSGTFSRAILWQDDPADPPKVIGGVVCRLERSPFDHANNGRYSRDLAKKAHNAVAPPPVDQSYALYIQSLGLLSPYRRYGLVAATVQGILDAALQVSKTGVISRGGLRIDWVYAHVWTENEEGLAWYTGRDFQQDSVLEDYYFKLKPGSAWVVKKRLAAGPSSAQGKENMASGVAMTGESPSAVPTSVTAAVVNMPAFATTTDSPPPNTSSPSPVNNGPPRSSATRPPPPGSSLSFQNKRPDMEWNDLPEDMVASSKNSSRSNLLAPPPGGSASSSRSSSTQRKKKDRAYPTAAYGS